MTDAALELCVEVGRCCSFQPISSVWIEEAVVEAEVGVVVLIIITGRQMIGADIETETVIIEEDTTTTITTADIIEEMIIESGWNVSVGNAWLDYELKMKQKREEIL